MDIKNIFKRVIPTNKVEPIRIKRLDINPSLRGLYIDEDGVIITPYSDTIEKKDFRWVRDSCTSSPTANSHFRRTSTPGTSSDRCTARSFPTQDP